MNTTISLCYVTVNNIRNSIDISIYCGDYDRIKLRSDQFSPAELVI